MAPFLRTAPVGKIVDVLGKPGENDTEMHAILAEYSLPYRFEPGIEDAAAKIPVKITGEEIKNRRDFRDAPTFTIDPPPPPLPTPRTSTMLFPYAALRTATGK
jgi:exoribonuclease R